MYPSLLRQATIVLTLLALPGLLIGCGDDAEAPPSQTEVAGVWTSADDSLASGPAGTGAPGGGPPHPGSTVAEPDTDALSASDGTETEASSSLSMEASSADSASTAPGTDSPIASASSASSSQESSEGGASEGVVSEGEPLDLTLGELRAELPAGLFPSGTRVRLVEELADATRLDALKLAFPDAVDQVRTWFRLEASLPPQLLPPEAALRVCLMGESAEAPPLALAQASEEEHTWQLDPFPTQEGEQDRCIEGVAPTGILALVECTAESCTP